MSTVAGWCSSEKQSESLAEAMRSAALHPADFETLDHSDPHHGVAACDAADLRRMSLYVSPEDRYVLNLFGSIYEPWAQGESAAAELFKRWQAQGHKAFEGLNGEYLITLWDRAERRLVMANDRFGMKRIHLWHDGSTLAWASSLRSLAVLEKMSRRVDIQALVELLIFANLQRERTLLEDVRLLAPGSVLEWQAGRIHVEQYWALAYEPRERFKNNVQAQAEYHDRLCRAVERRVKPFAKPGILLSGGLDSRALVGAFRKIRPQGDLFSWTSGHGHDHDSRFGRWIAKIIRSEHTEISIPEDYMKQHASRYAALLDGSVGAEGSHRAVLTPFVQGRTGVLLNGFLGDVLNGSNLLEKTAGMGGLDDVIQTAFLYYTDGLGEDRAARLLKPEIYGQVSGRAAETFAAGIRNARGRGFADRLGAATIWANVRGDAKAQVELLDHAARVACPFVDTDLVDFLQEVPLEYRINRRLYVDMIIRYFPGLASVPRSGEGLPLNASRLHSALHWRFVEFRRSTLPKLTRGAYAPHDYGLYIHAHEWFRGQNRGFITGKILGHPAFDDFFNKDALHSFVTRFLEEGSPSAGWKLIGRLLAFQGFYEALREVPRFPLGEVGNYTEKASAAQGVRKKVVA